MKKVFIFLLLVVYVKGDVTHGMYTNRNYQVPWDGPPVYNHTTTSTPRPDAVIELTFNNPQQLTTTTTATPPENDATTMEDGTIDLKVPGEENLLLLLISFSIKTKFYHINHKVKASKDVNFNMDLIFY